MGNQMNLLMQLLNSGNNPQSIVNNLISQNPQMRAIVSQAKQSGMSMQDYVMNVAKQRNIDIQPMINALKQRGVRF